jgi:hypothetical protein
MIINETGFMDLGIFSRTAEIMHEVHGRVEVTLENSRVQQQSLRESQENKQSSSSILCGMFLTAGWGGLMVLIMIALRIKMQEDHPGGAEQLSATRLRPTSRRMWSPAEGPSKSAPRNVKARGC